MKLLRFPLLIQKEIFEEFHPGATFSFSYCSKKMLNAMQKIQKIVKPEVQMEVGMVPGDEAYSIESRGNVERFIVVRRGELEEEHTQILKLSYLDLQCELFYDPSGIITIIHDEQRRPSPRIIEVLCSVFSTTKSDVVYKLNDVHSYEQFPPFPIKKSIVNISTITSMDQLNEFYSHYTLQDFSMVLRVATWDEEASGDNNIFLTKNLIWKKLGRHFNASYLANFKGEHAVFQGDRVVEHELNGFLKGWMAKKEDSLKSIIVELSEAKEWNKGQVLSGLQAKERTGADNTYQYESFIIQKYEKFPRDFFDCSNCVGITRMVDDESRTATIKLTPNYFIFLVW